MVPQIANFWNSFPLVLGRKKGNVFPCNDFTTLQRLMYTRVLHTTYVFSYFMMRKNVLFFRVLWCIRPWNLPFCFCTYDAMEVKVFLKLNLTSDFSKPVHENITYNFGFKKLCKIESTCMKIQKPYHKTFSSLCGRNARETVVINSQNVQHLPPLLCFNIRWQAVHVSSIDITPPLWTDLVKNYSRKPRHTSSFSLECTDFKKFWKKYRAHSEDTEVAEVKRPQNTKWRKFWIKTCKTRWNPKFGLGDLQNDLLTSTTSEWVQQIFSKIAFLKSGDQAEKNEL